MAISLKGVILLLLLMLSFSAVHAQSDDDGGLNGLFKNKIKVVQRGYGAVLGAQRGQYLFIDLGTEYFWRKVRLIKPHTFTLGGDFQYNFTHNTLGYRLYSYYRQGRINLTYGGGITYMTDFTYNRIGITPELGFRLLGFHLTTGANLLPGSKELQTFNKVYVGLNYYFPVDRKLKIKKKKN